MSYKAIYRKFRPRVFDDVLGQEHITTILKNQILNDNIAHAYLFSGTRGTGKTSTARILARAINCIDNKDGNPCNTCEVCEEILDESIMDIVEIDAASNNSVEDIRELRENSKYPPSKCRYKVYIVDEVHMLSKGAFNALLKVLEEPPKHLIFILATTEPQKLPATIISRCQRYDFKRVSIEDIVKNMKDICLEIDVNIEEKALYLIARNSDGAMRDALSILDQCISFIDGEITYDYILSTLGIVNNDLMFEIVNGIIDNDIDNVLNFIDTIVQNGIDINQFIKDMILHFRNLMISKTSSNSENTIDGSQEFIHQLKVQSEKIDLNTIITFLNILSEAETKSKWSTQPRVILEVSVIKMMETPVSLDIGSLVNRINKLEEQLKNGNIQISQNKRIEKKENKSTSVKGIENKKEEVNSTKVKYTSSTNIDYETVSSEWSNILNTIKKKKIGLHALIMEGKLSKFKNNIITLSFGEGFAFHRDALEKKKTKNL
ncbi:DNA polymerase III subunit gamma/tau [Gottschalkia acidurici 9a]|uniref:DNA-directed DNA polymerase n=1 Tax=Gottschalkia acidurici (strain ATCC 7906 / DSM 604 / BCRC 14475 / CIP 104303 / KCTC 5404 / NCIMB 10678 / 9a) TaxID=1128398 RepID=K0AV85_GOTA9|nr:DNA polymerase III subunit gamma/tau [Gottschalkia acidurici]AFS77179.1 DNA polymerase III subunit gamma/tau [Gottschalkia acidurici 9a]